VTARRSSVVGVIAQLCPTFDNRTVIVLEALPVRIGLFVCIEVPLRPGIVECAEELTREYPPQPSPTTWALLASHERATEAHACLEPNLMEPLR